MATSVQAPVTPQRIYQMAFAYAAPLILEAAIRHKVFDVLDDGPKKLAAVSKATGASERGLAAIMDILPLSRRGRLSPCGPRPPMRGCGRNPEPTPYLAAALLLDHLEVGGTVLHLDDA